jgi:hypothetical protein
MKTIYTRHQADRDLAGYGYYATVTTASGRTAHTAGYYKTAKEANDAAAAWIAGQREMAKAAQEPTPLG